MKPSEAKHITPGTVLAHRGYGGAHKLVVESVNVVNPRRVEITVAGGRLPYRHDELEFPTPEDLARWAKEDEKAAKRRAYEAEKARVSQVLGAKAEDVHTGAWGYLEAETYTVKLSREQALALVARLEPKAE